MHDYTVVGEREERERREREGERGERERAGGERGERKREGRERGEREKERDREEVHYGDKQRCCCFGLVCLFVCFWIFKKMCVAGYSTLYCIVLHYIVCIVLYFMAFYYCTVLYIALHCTCMQTFLSKTKTKIVRGSMWRFGEGEGSGTLNVVYHPLHPLHPPPSQKSTHRSVTSVFPRIHLQPAVY